MALAAVLCPKCLGPLKDNALSQVGFAPCIWCKSPVEVQIFPAFFRSTAPVADGEILLVDGEATCFNHANKKAVLPCSGCGRFLCALCDCEFNGEHFCPSCLEAGTSKGKIKNLQNRRTKYDSVALMLAVAPMVIFYFTIIGAPMALYVTFRYWKAPLGIGHSTRIRFVVASIIAVIQIVLWIVIAFFLVSLLNG